VKPHHTLAETTTPDGARLSLHEHDGVYAIRLNGRGLMDSSAAASELLLGEWAVAGFAQPRVLMGGLGLGFTLRRVLETTRSAAVVEVVELIAAVVDWNREHLLRLNGLSLLDPRVRVIIDDVWNVIAAAAPESYDAIVLDIDNGPVAMVQRQNARLYDAGGLGRVAAALRPGGRAAFWSAGRDASFSRRLARAGFHVTIMPAKCHAGARRQSCTIYLGQKRRGQGAFC
jgi:spermidine synthase